MSIRNFRKLLSAIEAEVLNDRALDTGFPHAVLRHAHEETTFEASRAAFDCVSEWASFRREEYPEANWDYLSGIIEDARIELEITLDCYEASETGGLVRLPDEAPPTERIRYHSLGNAAVQGGFKVSVFAHRLRAVPVYDGAEALDAQFKKRPYPDPIGRKSEYRVAILDGEIQHPPLWPSSIAPKEEHEGTRLEMGI